MMRLTEKDDLGYWFLKGLEWGQLREGQVITKDVAQKLYGALCKLKDYEDTKCSPEDVETLIEFGNDSIRIIAKYVKKCRWIPVSEMLPDKGDEFYPMNLVTVENGEICLGVYRWDDRKWWTRPEEGNVNYGTERKVLAWMPFPEPYREKVVVKSATNVDWQGHYIDRFEKVE